MLEPFANPPLEGETTAYLTSGLCIQQPVDAPDLDRQWQGWQTLDSIRYFRHSLIDNPATTPTTLRNPAQPSGTLYNPLETLPNPLQTLYNRFLPNLPVHPIVKSPSQPSEPLLPNLSQQRKWVLFILVRFPEWWIMLGFAGFEHPH